MDTQENLQIPPLGNVRLFRRIHTNVIRFLKMLVFPKICANSWETIQITPLGNARLFRRIRKNDILFLKTCVFREHLVNLCVVR